MIASFFCQQSFTLITIKFSFNQRLAYFELLFKQIVMFFSSHLHFQPFDEKSDSCTIVPFCFSFFFNFVAGWGGRGRQVLLHCQYSSWYCPPQKRYCPKYLYLKYYIVILPAPKIFIAKNIYPTPRNALSVGPLVRWLVTFFTPSNANAGQGREGRSQAGRRAPN